jgi:hypothetical protein
MADRELLELLRIVDGMFTLANDRARRSGSHRPEDNARERDLDDRLLRLREKLLADWRNDLVQARAAEHLATAVIVGNA